MKFSYTFLYHFQVIVQLQELLYRTNAFYITLWIPIGILKL